jgi:hypothetical protein
LTTLIIGLTFPLYGQENSNDTVFIQRDSLLGTAQSIYFDSNSNSKFYDRINNWEFGKYDTASYKYSTDYLKENNLILVKRKPIIPISKWVILKQYKGNFYVYHPCNFISHYKASINDTTYIDWTGEGPEASKIIKQKKISGNTFKFKLTGANYKDRVLKIHIIDSNKGIAEFKAKNKGDAKRHYFMIAADKINSVPIIVHNCEVQLELELLFDNEHLYTPPIIIEE